MVLIICLIVEFSMFLPAVHSISSVKRSGQKIFEIPTTKIVVPTALKSTGGRTIHSF